jgi:glucokinase-like ROK family protein
MTYPPPTANPDSAIPLSAPFALPAIEAQAIESIRKYGPLSRTAIADAMGYSRSRITSVINNLITWGILEEIGEGRSTGGRRPRVLTFKPEFGYLVGIDMGATSLDVAVADFSGRILDRHTRPINVREGPEFILGLACELTQKILERFNITPHKVYAFGIGVPGPVEFSTGLLISPPIMPGWNSYPIRAHIQEQFPCTVVIVDNDVNVMALGELRSGAGAGENNFIYVKIGTGIGAGIVCKGEIYRGANGCAGDIGHICADRNGPPCHCGNTGCLEAMAAAPAIAAQAMEIITRFPDSILAQYAQEQQGQLTAIDVGRAAAQGDHHANDIIRECGRMIGEVLASLVNFYNPSLVLIGGGVSNIGNQFLASIRRGILQRSLPLSTRHLRIDISPMGADAGIIGAISLAREHVFIIEGEASLDRQIPEKRRSFDKTANSLI